MGVGACFADHECSDTGLTKGENIRLVMERSGIGRAFYLGDTQGDLNAADQAGVPFVHAAYGFGKVDRAVPSIRDLAELPALGYVVVPQAQGPMVEAACPGHAFELHTY